MIAIGFYLCVVQLCAERKLYLLCSVHANRHVDIKTRHIETIGPQRETPTSEFILVFTMSFKLYGYPDSTYTRAAAIVAKERNIPYEFIRIDLQGGDHKQPAYLVHHPFGQVPYISVRRHPSPLYPCRLSYGFSYPVVE